MASEVDLQLTAASLYDIAGMSVAEASPDLVSVTIRRRAASEGKALKDGSFPIRNVSDLQRAIQAFGRAKDKGRAKRFIMKRARELKRPDLIPDAWKQSAKRTFDLAQITALDLILPEAPDPACGEFVKSPGPCTLDRSAKHNWVEDVGGLPNYICQVARAVARGGRTLDSAIPIAISTIKKWAAGRGDVSAAVRARAVAALAEWETKKARAHANSVETDTFELSDEDNELVELLVNADYEFDGKPNPPKLPDTVKKPKKYVQNVHTRKKNPVGVGRRGPYRSSGRTIVRNKRTVRLKLDGKPDGRSLRTNYKRFPRTAPAGQGGQFAPIGRGVKATKKKYGTAASLEENMTATLAALGDQVVVKDGPHKGKHGKIIGRAPKKDHHMVKMGDRVAMIEKAHCEKKDLAVTASGAALWDEERFSYFWDEPTDSTFRIDAQDTSVQVYDGAILDWTGTDLTSEEVSELPEVGDCESLEALVGAGEPEEEVQQEEQKPDEAAVATQEAADLAAATKDDEEVEKPEGSGEGGGPRFRIPLLIPETVWSGDRRRFAKDSLEVKEPPFPLLWQRETDEGHKRSVIVGRVDKASRLENGGIGNIEGVFDTHADAVEAARQVKGKFVTGVSGDVDKFDHELSQDEDGKESIEIKHGRVVAATIVAKPAFQEATIEIIPEDGEEAAIVASAGPVHPSQAWFKPPVMTEPYMFTVEDDGRCHGLIAEWGSTHTGNPAWKPPHNFSGYRYFNRKPVRTAEGTDVRCGQLTLTGGHAALGLDPDNVVRHYDDTRSAVADVVVGENEFGIWAAGAMRPDVSPEQIRAFRASEPSGDWRLRDGELELLAVCMVNTAGFPVMPRALVASGDKIVALVAAGMPTHVRKVDMQTQIEQLSAEVTALRSSLESVLTSRISPLEAEYETRHRMELAASIQALQV